MPVRECARSGTGLLFEKWKKIFHQAKLLRHVNQMLQKIRQKILKHRQQQVSAWSRPLPATTASITLASASPRRREILEHLGFNLKIEPAQIDELSIRHKNPEKQTLLLAKIKAETVTVPGRMTVSADTIVVLDKAVLEKPADIQEARQMLRKLSGRQHQVFTAVHTIFPAGQSGAFLEKTQVCFMPLTDTAIEQYINTSEPYDKAGGYGVQNGFGMAHIYRIEGCYFNVMGFPASRFMRFLSENQKFLHPRA